MSAPDQETAGSLLLKAAALLAFLVAADLWIMHHFGLGVGDPAALGTAVAIGSGLLAYLKSVVTSSQQKGMVGALRKAGRVFLWTPILAALYGGGAAVALVISTVRVVSDTPVVEGDVQLSYLDQPDNGRVQSAAGQDLVRFVVVTSPFGRAVRVSATGFDPGTFTVYPPLGLTIQLGRELVASPTVLFRPETRALQTLATGGSFRAWVISARGPELIVDTSGVMSSFLLGAPHVIPASLVEDWRLELVCQDALVGNQVLLAWKRPTVLQSRTVQPGRGARVRAEVRARNGTQVAETEVVIGGDPLIDVPVRTVGVDAGGCG